MSYSHTQKGWFHLLFGVMSLFLLSGAWQQAGTSTSTALLVGSVITGLVTLSFAQLTVSDDSDHLLIRFGPLPLFRRRVPYGDIQGAEAARSDILDGLGIHWLPGRGWIWNIWGTRCVLLQLPDRRLRVGTDDVEGLLALLRARAGQGSPGAPETDFL